MYSRVEADMSENSSGVIAQSEENIKVRVSGVQLLVWIQRKQGSEGRLTLLGIVMEE